MENFYVPQRFKGRTGYQIFVDRYNRDNTEISNMEGRIIKDWNDPSPNWWPDENQVYKNNYYYGGNLKGIIEKLEYIKKFGFNLIYLSPISHTETSHHYDVSDQLEIDPYIGNLEDFKMLIDKAHSLDILISVDLVFNHMGAHSKFFKEALLGSKYKEWFEWDGNDPVFWYGFKDLPQCNKFNVAYQEYVNYIIESYINLGVDAIRLDLGEIFPVHFMQGIRKKVKEVNPEVLIVSEMWDLATTRENPQIYGDQVDSVMNYPMADSICRWIRYGNYEHFRYTQSELDKYPKNVQDVLWNFLDSHDTPRVLNMLSSIGMLENPFEGRIWDIEAPFRSDDDFDTYGFRKWESENDSILDSNAYKKLKLASLIQYSMKGIPIVFAGTEVGVFGYKDPFNRKPYPWNNMIEELAHHYINLGNYRNSNSDIFSDSDILTSVNRNLMVIKRTNDAGTIYVAANGTDQIQDNPIYTVNGEEIFSLNDKHKQKVLRPYGASVIREK